MARVTVEDCLEKVPNRFALTVLASRRARALSEGRGSAMVECDNKSGVTALREVAADKVRYEEDVAGVVRDFIEEQRSQLRSTSKDNTFLEAVPLSIGDEDEDEDFAAAVAADEDLDDDGDGNENAEGGDGDGDDDGEQPDEDAQLAGDVDVEGLDGNDDDDED